MTINKICLLFLPHLDVGHLVVVQVAGCSKPFSTDPALVGLLPAVDPTVGVERGGGGETLAADITDVRPLPGVDADVALEQARTIERLAAVVAREHVLLSPPDDRRTRGGRSRRCRV